MNNIHIPWKNQSNLHWNDLCAQVVEHFGLPGERYISQPEEDWMIFSFYNEQDYLMCKMLLSEHIVERNVWTLTVGEDGVITFPDDVLKKTGWQEGDIISWKEGSNGCFILEKVVQ